MKKCLNDGRECTKTTAGHLAVTAFVLRKCVPVPLFNPPLVFQIVIFRLLVFRFPGPTNQNTFLLLFQTHIALQVFGLPGFMCRIVSMKEPLEVYGPVGLRRFLRTALRLSQTLLDYEYVVHELLPVPEQLTMHLHVRTSHIT